MEALLFDPFRRLLEGSFPPGTVRAIEAGTGAHASWEALHRSGYLDALAPESAGGFGLPLADLCDAFELCGYLAVPVPVGQTMLARSFLASAGLPAPEGPIVLADVVANPDGGAEAHNVPDAGAAAWALVFRAGTMTLLPAGPGQTGSEAVPLAANLRWSGSDLERAEWIDAPGCDALTSGATILAAQLAGAMTRLFEMTLRHANERSQFGRPLGKFQAIQHQISLMAEQTSMARAAARLGCRSPTPSPDATNAAIAKSVTSSAAPAVAAIAHAVHGAIGISEEFDLQLFTRRLHTWRTCAGSELYWNRRLGQVSIDIPGQRALDALLSRQPSPSHEAKA